MSERQLSKSYSSIQEWKFENGNVKRWIRWDFAKLKQKWLEKNELTEKWLKENLEWMIDDGEIISIKKADESRLYYVVTTEKGGEYYLVFEMTKGVNCVVLVFEDHWQNYDYNERSHTLRFSCEQYDYSVNDKNYIMFRYDQQRNSVFAESIIVGGAIYMEFCLKKALPIWKTIRNYQSLLEEICKYDSRSVRYEERQIEKAAKIANLVMKLKSEEVLSFRAAFDRTEWVEVDQEGEISMKARLKDGGNFAVCENGRIECMTQINHYDRGYRIEDGVILNYKNEKVIDPKIQKAVISEIRAAKDILHQVKQIVLA